MRFKIILEEDEEVGGFFASCPGLPGCFSQGDTVEEAIENINEAVQACLESLAEDESHNLSEIGFLLEKAEFSNYM